MNSLLYDKINNLVKSGNQISVIYSPHHKGCECDLNTDVKDTDIRDFLFDALESWWYDDLVDNYLIPKDIFGGGEFKFEVKSDSLFVNANIHMSSDNYDDYKLYDYFDNSIIDLLKLFFEGKTLGKDHVLFTFESNGASIQNLEIIYLGEKQDDFVNLELPEQLFVLFEQKICSIVNSFKYYTKNIENGSIWVSCNENRISVSEDWPISFKVNKDK